MLALDFTMRGLLILVSLLLSCRTINAAENAVVCQDLDTSFGRKCSLQASVETVTIIGNKLIVGSSNSLLLMSFELYVEENVDLSPQASTYDNCVGFELAGQLGNDPSLCQNFIKLIQRIPGGEKILVCGTNAFRPRCTLHNIANISVFEPMSNDQTVDSGFSPYSKNGQVVATITSAGRFFSGTRFDALAQVTIGMAPNLLQRDNVFAVNVPTSNRRWLQQPKIISSYETERHIYFFLQERAYEVNQGETVVYSRAIRICKSDDGMSPEETYPNNFFLTFQKARISCSSLAAQGTIPFSFDNLQSTVMSVEPDGQKFLYGVFTSPINGPSGSAICKYSFDSNSPGSLTQVFEDGQYLVSEGNPPIWRRVPADTFSCPGESGSQRSSSDASQYQLVLNSVTSVGSQPLYTVSGKRLDKVAIDVINYNQTIQTVLYFSSQEGDIHQLMINDQGTRTEYVINQLGSALTHLIIHRNLNETRSLFAATEALVMSISLGKCSQYSNCFACLDSHDPYCGWSGDRCINKLTANASGVIQSITVSKNEVVDHCGPRPNPTTPPPHFCETAQPSEQTTDNPKMCTTSIGNLSPASDSSVSIPDLVGATVGSFVVGIPFGAFVCFIFLKLFTAPKKHKHTINRQTQPRQANSNAVTQVNNQLIEKDQQQIQKKDLTSCMSENPSYVQTSLQLNPIPLSLAPPPLGNMHKRKNSKDINMYVSPEVEMDDTFDEPDQVPPLRSFNSADNHSHRGNKTNVYSHTTTGVGRKKVPGHALPRGRTDSTTWLRVNSESSEPPSPLGVLDSPISDV